MVSSLEDCHGEHFASIFNIEVLEMEAEDSPKLLEIVYHTTLHHTADGSSYLSIPKKLSEFEMYLFCQKCLARGSLVVKALGYKPEGRRFERR
jgi:hypothetical protein